MVTKFDKEYPQKIRGSFKIWTVKINNQLIKSLLIFGNKYFWLLLLDLRYIFYFHIIRCAFTSVLLSNVLILSLHKPFEHVFIE